MPPSIPNPHDALFHELFSRGEVAEGFLRAYLPPALIPRIDWFRLEIAKDSFVDNALRKHFSDLVYGMKYGGKGIKVYLLFEHKSHPEYWVGLQLLRYQVRIWELHRKQHPDQPLPPIIPLVLYHGKERWQVPQDFHGLFGDLEVELVPYVPEFRHEMYDLRLPEPETIRSALLVRMSVLALKHAFDEESEPALREIMRLGREVARRETAMEMLAVIMRYYAQIKQDVNENIIEHLLIETGYGEGVVQTFIDRYIEQGRQQGWIAGKQEGRQEGRQKGRQEGRQEGRQKGRQEGQAILLIRQMTRKFGPLTAQQRRRIKRADAETLLRWCEQLLFAETPEDALR